MAPAPRILHLVLLALAAVWLVPQVSGQYIHRGWQPGLPSKLEGEPEIGSNYRKDRGWSPKGVHRPPLEGAAAPQARPSDVPPASTETVPKPPRVPRNQTYTEQLMRFGLTKVLHWSDDRVDETQDRLRERNNPTFHPIVKQFDGANTEYTRFIEELGFAHSGTLDQESVLAGMINSVIPTPTQSVTKPWAILFSAPGGDKESHKFNQIFNRTLHSLYPDASTGFTPIIKGGDEAETAKAVEKARAEAVAEPTLPEGYENIGGFIVRVADIGGAPEIPRRQNFLVSLISKGFSLLLGSGDSNTSTDEDDANAIAESELTGKEILTPKQWGVRQAIVDANLPGVEADELQFGAIDFLKEPALTWIWGVYKVPLVVFVTPSPPGSEHPYDLRYWKVSQQMPTVNDAITFLGSGSWKQLPVWESTWAPGGSKFPRVVKFATFAGRFYYPIMQRMPSWLLMILSTVFASYLPKLMHPGDNKKLKDIEAAKKRRKAFEEAREKAIADKAVAAKEVRQTGGAVVVTQNASTPVAATSPRTKAAPAVPRPQTRKLRAGRR